MARKRRVIPIKSRPKRRTLGFGTFIRTGKTRNDKTNNKSADDQVTHTLWESDQGFFNNEQTSLWHDDTENYQPNKSTKAIGGIPPWENQEE